MREGENSRRKRHFGLTHQGGWRWSLITEDG